jgi:hypothetical protein
MAAPAAVSGVDAVTSDTLRGMSDRNLADATHVLLGARASGYPGVSSGLRYAINDHERRIGRRVHLALDFAKAGAPILRSRQHHSLARRANTMIVQCWKPAARWADAGGDDRAVTAYIKAQAAAVKALRAPVALVVHHEPENDIGRAGTAQEYRRMWAHVRTVFDDYDVQGVQWGVAYMNYPPHDDVLPDLFPRKHLPDWVWFNAYGSRQRPDFTDNVGRFYEGLAERRWFDPGAARWGVREWSTKGLDSAAAAAYFDDAREAVGDRRFPRLDALMVFDSPGHEEDRGMQIGFDSKGRPDLRKQAAYRDFAHEDDFGPVVAPG